MSKKCEKCGCWLVAGICKLCPRIISEKPIYRIPKVSKKRQTSGVKSKKTAVQIAEEQADKAFGDFIKERDKKVDSSGQEYWECICCKKRISKKNVQAGHYKSRRHKAIRYDEMNCFGQFSYCNKWLHGNEIKYREALVEKFGEAEVQKLEMKKNNYFQRTVANLNIITQLYRKKLKDLIESRKT